MFAQIGGCNSSLRLKQCPDVGMAGCPGLLAEDRHRGRAHPDAVGPATRRRTASALPGAAVGARGVGSGHDAAVMMYSGGAYSP